MPVYRVEHHTAYVYSSPVATSQHVAHLCPRVLPYQRVRQHALVVEPKPANFGRRIDYFGNLVDHFQILRPHSTLDVFATSVVEVCRSEREVEPADSPSWEEVRSAIGRPSGVVPVEVAQFASVSPYVPASRDLEAFVQASFPPGQSVLGGAIDLMHRVHARFTFDADATAVATPLTKVLEHDRGVCQDFAHVAIACLRALGLGARYVSGYLLTDPPPGQARLIGADASHAWLAVYSPGYGWVDLDPTNDVIVGDRHVTVAWGRDFGDVSPLRGVLLGGAEHTLDVAVSVHPLEGVETAPDAC